MGGRIVVFGATGYTGRLVAERLVAAGARPVLAGRSPERLEELASSLGGLEVARADAMRQNTVFALVDSADDVLVATVGPFAKWGGPAVRAAAPAGCTYLDSTGEPEFIRRVFGEMSGPAARAGARLMTAMGYDFVPGALAGALALEEAGADAVRVDVGYYALGGMVSSLSAGTKETLVGVTLTDGHAFRDGRIVTVRSAERVRSFPVAGRDRAAISVGGAEHFSLPAVYPGLREVNVYLGWFGPLARPLQALSLGTELLTRLPGMREALRVGGERLVALTGAPESSEGSTARSWIAAEALDASGRPLASVTLSGAEPYAFTGALLAWAARRAAHQGVNGSGALGPVEAFGLDALREGVERSGLTVVA
jgi:short subunit dehydrogenase-like uncharacterized protein